MDSIKKNVIWLLRRTSAGHEVLNLYLLRKLLKQNGWLKSAEKHIPMDGDGNPVPWYTYAFIHFLTPRVRSDMTVYEYGSGYSTMWWADRVKSVVTCEHDEAWYKDLKGRLPANVDSHHVALEYGGDYSRHILQYEKAFDVVIIDGRDRVNCAKNAIGALKEAGVIIWDNSDRDYYSEGMQYLEGEGFKRIDFYGHGPVSKVEWGTTVFYRDENCLGI